MKPTFDTRKYRNLLEEIGASPQAIDDRIRQTWTTMFAGPEDERIYWEDGADRGYMVDTGNNDVRTEGMSYGMMMAVQLDEQQVFNRLWLWAKTFLQHQDGPYQHFFAWSAETNGTRRAQGPAPDGEEYFALALFFASHRWGEGASPFDYARQARTILRACVHRGKDGNGGHPMWDPETALIRFVPETPWTDPSYHLPHFYELFALWADPEDRPFWRRAAAASRAYLVRACHPVTGLAPEYSEYDGTPHQASWDYGHHHFYSDSYRVAANLGLDVAWFGANPGHKAIVDRLHRFFADKDPSQFKMYRVDGTPLEEPALHPQGLIATNAMGALATEGPQAQQAVELFWQTPLRKGGRRYYDNCLILLSLLALSGRYRVW
jgi:oligosaccharide reducing-end xylanase